MGRHLLTPSGTLSVMGRTVWVLLALAAAFWLCGTDSPQPSGRADPAAERALEAVTLARFDPVRPAASFPADFPAVMGYTPIVIGGPDGTPILAKPTGDCSSFTGRTAYDFTAVCMEHDLAYDVVRYAHHIGGPLEASARRAADDMFGRDLHGRCDQLQVEGLNAAACHMYAEGFVDAVRINSWRQGYRSPEPESNWRWTAMLLLTLSFALVPRVAGQQRRNRQRNPFGIPVIPVVRGTAHPRRGVGRRVSPVRTG